MGTGQAQNGVDRHRTGVDRHRTGVDRHRTGVDRHRTGWIGTRGVARLSGGREAKPEGSARLDWGKRVARHGSETKI